MRTTSITPLVGRAMLAVLLSLAATPVHAQVAPPAAGGVRARVTPLEPCCNVVAVDARTGTVTYAFKATGARFQFQVPAADLRSFEVGLPMDVAGADGVQCTSQAATSTSCGSNVGRNADTRPKDCTATDSAGVTRKIVCPPR